MLHPEGYADGVRGTDREAVTATVPGVGTVIDCEVVMAGRYAWEALWGARMAVAEVLGAGTVGLAWRGQGRRLFFGREEYQRDP